MRRACGCRRRAALSAARGQPVYTEAPMSPPPDNYPLLCAIESPADLRRLPAGKLPALAAELRAFLIHSVSTRGGHFAAGLGTVGLTIALHYVFDTPRSEEHTSELQSQSKLVCRLLLEKKK